MRDEERRVYELHAHEGAERLKALEPLANISRIIENHHERYNGTGFPNKTRGGKIPMRSLIIGICDFYDNLNERPHTDLEYHAHLTFQRISDTRENEFPDRLVTLMAELIEQQQRSKLNQDAIRVGLRDLAPKMRLARNIYTVTGSLLAAQGTELTAKAISRIRAVAQVDRIAGEVYVLPRKSRDESTASPINHSD